MTRRRKYATLIVLATSLLGTLGVWFASALHKSDLNRKLVHAIKQNNAALAISCIEAGADPNCSMEGWEQQTLIQRVRRLFASHGDDALGKTPAFVAACSVADRTYHKTATGEEQNPPIPDWPSPRLAVSMLKHGAVVKGKAGQGGMAAQQAIHAGNYEIARLLADSGVDFYDLDGERHSALMFAAFENQTDLVKRLLRSGANVNQQDSAGYTPTMIAVHYASDPDVLVALLEAGADPNLRTYAGDDPLDVSVAEGRAQNARILKAYGGKLTSGLPSGPPVTAVLLGCTVGKDKLLSLYSPMKALAKVGPSSTTGRFGAQTGWASLTIGGSVEAWGSATPGHGFIVDFLDWSTRAGKPLPPIPAAMSSYLWMDAVHPGMTKEEVAAAVKGRVPPPERIGDTWKWYTPGKMQSGYKPGTDYTCWSTSLYFTNGLLRAIQIVAHRPI
jgi:hypothetical protein